MDNEKVKENIDKYGWQYQFVFDPDGEKPDFAYSIGFEESYNHPEIMIFGLKRETMHIILGDIAEEIKNGKFFETNKKIGDVISGDYEVIFKPLIESLHSKYAGAATYYYKKPIRIYVMFWPDKNNILPTESNCELTTQDEALKIV